MAPDGKIYIASPGSCYLTKCITNPDVQGVGCGLVHNYVNVSAWFPNAQFTGGMPNNPNYRLGALVGSGCDTLESGVGELAIGKEQILIYPNPVGELLMVNGYQLLGNANTIHIYDVLGREACIIPPSKGGQGGFSIDVSKLSSGVYFLQATDEKGNVRMGKFVKE